MKSFLSETLWISVIEACIMSASCFEVTFIALHSSYCHSLLSLCSQQARGQELDIIPQGGSCWPSLLMLSAIHDKRYEMGTRWLKCLCLLVLGIFTLTACVIVFQRRDMLFFPLFPLKPVIMMSPTCQPDDGWITQQRTVTFIIDNRDNSVPTRNISRHVMYWKNAGMRGAHDSSS